MVGGHSRCAGRVEVLHRGQWGTVCDNWWDLIDAAVVCRELDCGNIVDAPGNAYFGLGSGPIWMTNVVCTGSELTLKHCDMAGWDKQNCIHAKDAGVICAGKFLYIIYIYIYIERERERTNIKNECFRIVKLFNVFEIVSCSPRLHLSDELELSASLTL